MIVEDINLCFLLDWKDSFLKLLLSEATLTFIFLAYYFIANKAILSFYFPDSFIGFIVILVSMLKVFKQLRKHQLINFVKDYRCQLAPTTSVSYPLLNMLTLTSKFSSTSHAIHHKNLIKSNYEGRGFEV
jgi:fatty acid desaturase